MLGMSPPMGRVMQPTRPLLRSTSWRSKPPTSRDLLRASGVAFVVMATGGKGMCMEFGCAVAVTALSSTPATAPIATRLTRASGCSCPGDRRPKAAPDLEQTGPNSSFLRRPSRDEKGGGDASRCSLAVDLRNRTTTAPRSCRSPRHLPLTRLWNQTLLMMMHLPGPRGDRGGRLPARRPHLPPDLPHHRDPRLCQPRQWRRPRPTL